MHWPIYTCIHLHLHRLDDAQVLPLHDAVAHADGERQERTLWNTKSGAKRGQSRGAQARAGAVLHTGIGGACVVVQRGRGAMVLHTGIGESSASSSAERGGGFMWASIADHAGARASTSKIVPKAHSSHPSGERSSTCQW